MGYSLWGGKESDTTEQLLLAEHIRFLKRRNIFLII